MAHHFVFICIKSSCKHVVLITDHLCTGIRRQAVEYFLPGGSEGWPGGVRQQYAIAQPLLEGTIRDVKRLPSLQVCGIYDPACVACTTVSLLLYASLFGCHRHAC